MNLTKRDSLIVKAIFTAFAVLAFTAFFIFSPMQTLASMAGVNGAVILSFFILILVLTAAFFVFKIKLNFPISFLCILAICAAALSLRVFLFDHASRDYNVFLSQWLSQMRPLSFREAITTPIGDYNMPYLYFLALISRLNLNELYLIKLLSVIFDFVLALSVTKLVSLFKKSDGALLISFTLSLFAPTVFLNSAYWGQCDTIYAALCIWALYFALKEKGGVSMVLFSLAFSFKMQSIFIFPVIIFLILKHKISLKHIIYFPITFLLTLVPALLCGRSFYDTFSIYIDQTSSYPSLTLNCPSLWALLPENEYNFSVFGSAALFVAGAAVLVFGTLVYLKKDKLDTKLLFDCAFIFTLIMPFFLPRMHERYFYLAEVLSIVYVLIHKDRLFVAPALTITGFCVYSAYLFGNLFIKIEILSIINAFIIIYVIKKFYDDLSKNPALPCKKECF